MARRKALTSKNGSPLLPIIALLLFPLVVLIWIGDAVRWILHASLMLLTITWNILVTLRTTVQKAVLYWITSFISQRVTVKRRGRPKKSLISKIAKRLSQRIMETRRAIRVAASGIHLPTLQFPVAFPKIVFPRLFRPSYHVIYPPSKRVFSDQVKSFFAGVVVTLIFLFLPYSTYRWLRALPNPQLLAKRDIEVTTKIFDRNGSQLYEIYTNENRTPIPLSDIPKYVKDATVAIEDREFYRHQGFSPRGILRSVREIVFKNRIQGGSTITQQLIKSALLTPEVSISRKVKEIFLAFWAERMFTKDQILEMYLNQVPYGGTAWGIEAASRTYFGKSVKDLSLAESALLAGLPAAPTEYSPFGSHPEKAFERQAEVLRAMIDDRYIRKEEGEQALSQTIHFVPPRIGIRAPHFVMYIRELLEKRYSTRLVEQGGLRVVTSLDSTIQEKVEDIVRSHVESLKNLRVGNGAALVTNPKTGEILAMVGSKNYFDLEGEGNVNVTTSLRPPGSSIKVVNYAAALENGLTAASVLDDSPVVYRVPGTTPYAPVNYDGKFHGLVPLRYALGNSYNVPAVKVLAKIGVPTMIEKGRLMGIESWADESRYGLSLTLGGGDVTMLEMAKVFGTLANNGNRADLLPILEVTDYTGKVFERSHPKKEVPAVKPSVAWIIGNILSDNFARTAAFGQNSSLVIPGKTVSVKTGTSNDKRDNWTIGFTPSYVVAVWVGNNNNTPMDPVLTSGITGAAPIWHDIMAELLKEKENEVPPKPENVIALPCYFNRVEYFVKGTEPAGGRCAPLPTPTSTPTPTP